jgi:NADH:ubiquinone oxidoreductase subunit 3 (subunit A)
MNTLLILFIFVPILALILLLLNVFLSPNRPDSEKVLTYECGFSPILGQTRNTFHISFFLIALAFLILDLEILLFFPISVSIPQIGTFGLIIALLFFILLTLGYIIEILAGNLKVSNSSITPTLSRKGR